jgi:hypothetical protein
MIKKHYDFSGDQSGGGVMIIPDNVKKGIEEYADCRVRKGAVINDVIFGYRLAQAELAALKEENERLRKGLGEVKSYIEDSDVPMWSISSIESIIEAALK